VSGVVPAQRERRWTDCRARYAWRSHLCSASFHSTAHLVIGNNFSGLIADSTENHFGFIQTVQKLTGEAEILPGLDPIGAQAEGNFINMLGFLMPFEAVERHTEMQIGGRILRFKTDRLPSGFKAKMKIATFLGQLA